MAEEPDLIISAGFSDAQLVSESNKVVAAFRKRGEEAQKAFQDAQGRVTNTQAARAHARELDRLSRAYDPAYRAAKVYEEEVKRLDRALQVGAISQQQHSAKVVDAAKKMRDAGNIAGDTSKRIGAQGNLLQQFGYQAGDFAVQVQAGTSAAQAFAQQAPQFLGAMGAWGAMAGLAVAVAVPVGNALLKMALDTETLEDKLKSLEKSTGAYVDAVEAASTPIDQLRLKYGGLADEIARVNGLTVVMADVQSRKDLLGTANKFGGGLFGSQSFGSFVMDVAAEQMGASATEAQKLSRAYKVSAEQADLLLMARRRLETSNSEDAVRRDAQNLLDVYVAIAGSQEAAAERFPTEMQTASALVTQAAEKIAAAQRAQREAQQDLLDAYDTNTQKLKKLAGDRALAEESLTTAVTDGKTEQADAYARVIKAIDEEVRAVKQSIAEMDGTFEASVKRMQDLAARFGFTMDGSAQLVPTLNQDLYDATNAAAQRGILDLIGQRESGGDYNATLDNGRWTGGPRSLVNMTLNEVRALQEAMRTTENRALYGNGAGSSALGKYQIVGSTLDGLMRQLNLSGDELFDKDMQDRLANQLLRQIRPGDVDGLRSVWTSTSNVPDSTLLQAWNQQSIPRVDPEIAKGRKKTLDDEVRERERLLKQARAYGEQLSANLLSEQKQAELAQSRAQQINDIKASGMSDRDQATAIAAVNAEIEKQTLVFTLLEEAKRRQVDLDAKLADGSMSYRQAIEALGETKKQQVVLDEQRAQAEQNVAARAAFSQKIQADLKNGILDSIIAGDSFADVLGNVAQALARAALQAALFNEGVFASGSGGSGLLGGIVSAISGWFGGGASAPAVAGARASGGPVRAGVPYLVNENTPRSEIWVPSHSGAVLNVPQAQAALRGRSGGSMTFAPSTSIVVQGNADRQTLTQMRRELDARDQRMRREIPGIMKRYNLTDG